MNDLPDPAQSSVTSNSQDPNPKSVSTAYSSGNKEEMSGGYSSQESLKTLPDKMELPKKYIRGSSHATNYNIVPPVAILECKRQVQMFLYKPTNCCTLTDDQIAKGLHEGINTVRWLAEWCVRKLKHLHYTLKNVHGSLVR
jgi:hypothetical protein